MIYQEFPPCPRLRPYIACLWALEAPECSGPIAVERIVPDGRMELIVEYEAPMEALTDQAPVVRQSASLAGQISEALLLRPTGRVGMVGARFRTHGAAPFVSLPLNELAGNVWTLEDILGPEGRHLAKQVVETPTPRAKLDRLESFLLSVYDPKFDDNVFRRQLNRVYARDGAASLDSLFRESGRSRRQFERLFLRNIGLAPKTWERIFRVQTAIRMKRERPETKLTDIAVALDYFDQSHFVHDFRGLVGLSPTAYFAEQNQIAGAFAGRPEESASLLFNPPSAT